MSIEELKYDTIEAKTLSIRMERVWHQISLQLFTNLNTLLCSKNRKKKLPSIKQEGIKVILKLEFDLVKWSIIENIQTINKVKPMDQYKQSLKNSNASQNISLNYILPLPYKSLNYSNKK